MKMFIDSNFKMVDMNDDGIIDADEYRFSCITKFPIDDVEIVDDAFNSMLNVSMTLKFVFIFNTRNKTPLEQTTYQRILKA